MDPILDWITQYGYAAVFVLLMIGIAGAFIPDDLILTFTGYLIFSGYLHPVPAFLCAWTGSLCGITLSYGLGRILGIAFVEKYGAFVHVTAESMTRVNIWYERLGKWALSFGYFLAGVRHCTAFAAGVSKVRFPIFALFAYTGGFAWAAVMISAGYLLGENWHLASDYIRNYVDWPVFILFVAAIVLIAGYFLVRGRSGR
jgi:membrane protein DedA with SNARE-associated domain